MAQALSALMARLVGAGGPNSCRPDDPVREGVGVVMLCPCQGKAQCVGLLYVPFANPIDGGHFLDVHGVQRVGDTIESLTLLSRVERLGGCGWVGWVQNGEAADGL
jgi:hypothetical protein